MGKGRLNRQCSHIVTASYFSADYITVHVRRNIQVFYKHALCLLLLASVITYCINRYYCLIWIILLNDIQYVHNLHQLPRALPA